MGNINFAKAITLFGLLMTAEWLVAAPRLSEAPSFYLDLQYGQTTSKSKLVESNDTGSSMRYGLGSFAGQDSQFGFRLFGTIEQTKFALNDSAINGHWQDTMLNYFFGSFYLSVMLSRLEIKVEQQGETIFDAAGSGFGFGAGWLQMIGRSNVVYLDVFQASIAELKNAEDLDLAIPQRMEVDIGARVSLWEQGLDLNFGYRLTNLTYSSISNFSDTTSTTYLGLRLSLYF